MDNKNNILIFPLTMDFDDDVWVDMSYSLTSAFYRKKEDKIPPKKLSKSNWIPRIID